MWQKIARGTSQPGLVTDGEVQALGDGALASSVFPLRSGLAVAAKDRVAFSPDDAHEQRRQSKRW
jgi:hypothetical protein